MVERIFKTCLILGLIFDGWWWVVRIHKGIMWFIGFSVFHFYGCAWVGWLLGIPGPNMMILLGWFEIFLDPIWWSWLADWELFQGPAWWLEVFQDPVLVLLVPGPWSWEWQGSFLPRAGHSPHIQTTGNSTITDLVTYLQYFTSKLILFPPSCRILTPYTNHRQQYFYRSIYSTSHLNLYCFIPHPIYKPQATVLLQI